MNRHAASFKKKTTYCRASGTFRLRHFNLDHQTSSQKLGTDSLLLGAWASADILSRWPESNSQLKALDVGTGSGCLALMLAQQASLANKDLTVDAIDIDHDTCGVARRNVEASPWPSLVRVQCLSFQDLVESSPPGSYEVIISNPPYFKGSTKPPSDRRATARHQDTALPFSALAAGASHLLSTNHPSSAIYLILPSTECDRFCSEADAYGLELSHVLRIRTLASDAVDKRKIMRFSRRNLEREGGMPHDRRVVEEELVVSYESYDEELSKRYWINTEGYDRLTEPFHHPDHIGKRRY